MSPARQRRRTSDADHYPTPEERDERVAIDADYEDVLRILTVSPEETDDAETEGHNDTGR